tara:strand:+ start:235 stop:1008 length:774 start_codon:yes stop_codon:yes gene_type:complete
MQREERRFMGRMLLIMALICGAIWIYDFTTRARYDNALIDRVVASDSTLTDDELAQAFKALHTPHIFSGIHIPDSLLPSGAPLLNGRTTDEVLSWFIEGSSLLRTAPTAKDDPATAIIRELSQGRTGKNWNPRILENGGFALCRQSPRCVGELLARQYPRQYNGLLLIHYIAQKKTFSNKLQTVGQTNLGTYIRARKIATARDYGFSSTELPILQALARTQRNAAHSTMVLGLFLTVGTALLAAFALWSRRTRLQAG